MPVTRLQLSSATGTLGAAPKKDLFLRGPIPLDWLSVAAHLPGKTINLTLAVWWRHGMSKGRPFKLSQTALRQFNVERDAERAGLARLEQEGLIKVDRKPGQRPYIEILLPPKRQACEQKLQKVITSFI